MSGRTLSLPTVTFVQRRTWMSGCARAPKMHPGFFARWRLGAPLQDLTERDLSGPGLIFQIGVPPVRIDVITAIDGVEFPDAWTDRVEAKLGDVPVPVLSRQHLIANKKAAGCLQDLADVERLEEMAAVS